MDDFERGIAFAGSRLKGSSLRSVETNSGQLVTNTLSQLRRVQRWGNFIAGFSVEFVESCLEDLDPQDGLVLDPFAGCGTTFVASQNLGFSGIGFEPHNIFHAIASAKIGTFSSADLQEVSERLHFLGGPRPLSDSALAFLAKMFPEPVLQRILISSVQVQQLDERLLPLGVAIFLQACELACGSQTEGIYKAPSTAKKRIPFEVALRDTVDIVSDDLSSTWYLEKWYSPHGATIYRASATDMSLVPPSSVIACVTSPPYLNNFDYAEMTRMQSYLLGWAANWKEITETVRLQLLTNTCTALQGRKTKDYQQQQRAALPETVLFELDDLVSQLRVQYAIRAGKKDYYLLVYPYFSQIQEVLRGIYRALKPGAKLHWVVVNSALYGIHIATERYTAQLMAEIGFEQIDVRLVRTRGTRWQLEKRDGSQEGLAEFHITAVKGGM